MELHTFLKLVPSNEDYQIKLDGEIIPKNRESNFYYHEVINVKSYYYDDPMGSMFSHFGGTGITITISQNK